MRIGKNFAMLVVFLMLSLTINTLAVDLSVSSQQKLNPWLKILARKSKVSLTEIASKEASFSKCRLQNGEVTLGVFIKSTASKEELEKMGAEVKTWTGDFCTANVSMDALQRIAENPKVAWIEAAMLTYPTLNISVPGSASAPYLGVNAPPAYWRWQGEDVIVGIVDSGIDWTHGDFIDDSSNNTRILSIWDQNLTATGSESAPSGYSYGVEYTSTHINNEIDGSPAGFVRSKDLDGHGTHVAGTAAGDGSDSDGSPPAGTYAGVAPKANIIMVSTTYYDDEIADGVAYIFEKADELGKPAVVNLSLGNQLGPHDGTTSFESTLNNLQGPGKIIVASAGNERGADIHAEANVPASVTVNFSVQPASNVFLMGIDIWYDGGDSYSISVTAPNLSSTPVVSPGNELVGHSLGTQGVVDIDNSVLSDPTNGDGNAVIAILTPVTGTWQFTLTRVASGGDGDFDAWMQSVVLSGYPPKFTSNVAVDELIGNPAAHPNLLAVAAHITKTSWTASNGSNPAIGGGPYNLGELTGYSSPGPSRDTPSDPGHQKPDICAPGTMIAAALSDDASYATEEIVDDSRHAVMQGTSMSAPHVAGAVALMLDKKGDLTPQEMRSLISSSAYTDGYTGAVPNYDYGYGKINVEGLINSYLAVETWNLYE